MTRFHRSRWARLLALSLFAVLVLPLVAVADIVVINYVSVSGTSTLAPGQAGTLTISLSEENQKVGDVNGCNTQGNNPITVSLSAAPGIQLSQSSVTLNGCGSANAVSVSFSVAAGTAAGTYLVQGTPSGGVSGSFTKAGETYVSVVVTDSTPPSTTATASPNTAWSNSDVTVSLSAVDNTGGSGVKSITYWATGAHPVSSTTLTGSSASVTISTSGTTVVYYAATDNANNTEPTGSITVNVDKVNPTITTNTNGYTAGTWTKDDVKINFTCADAHSGIETCEEEEVVLSESGSHSVTATATDKVGNSATSAAISVLIDKVAPTVEVNTNGYTAGQWTKDPVTINFTCADAHSGIASCVESLVELTTTGEYTVTATATDNVGNTYTTDELAVWIDMDAPTITYDTHGYELGTWTNQSVKITFTCEDAHSGIDSCKEDEVEFTTTGQHTAKATATDNVGNTFSTSELAVWIDKVAPTVSLSLTSGWKLGAPVTPSVVAADAHSGVADSGLKDPVPNADGTTTYVGWAVDHAGNRAESAAVTVGFFSLKTWAMAGKGTYRLNSTVPITYTLDLPSGADPMQFRGCLRFVKTGSPPPEAIPDEFLYATSTAQDNTCTFRYDATASQYVLNFNTKASGDGSFDLYLDFGSRGFVPMGTMVVTKK